MTMNLGLGEHGGVLTSGWAVVVSLGVLCCVNAVAFGGGEPASCCCACVEEAAAVPTSSGVVCCGALVCAGSSEAAEAPELATRLLMAACDFADRSRSSIPALSVGLRSRFVSSASSMAASVRAVCSPGGGCWSLEGPAWDSGTSGGSPSSYSGSWGELRSVWVDAESPAVGSALGRESGVIGISMGGPPGSSRSSPLVFHL